jgi:ribonuclease HIII
MISKGYCNLFILWLKEGNSLTINIYKSNKITIHWAHVNIAARHKQDKQILYNLKINGCAICGYNKCIDCLEFHHINPADKKYCISQCTLGRKDLNGEINKCILLCPNCHKEIHAKEREKK